MCGTYLPGFHHSTFPKHLLAKFSLLYGILICIILLFMPRHLFAIFSSRNPFCMSFCCFFKTFFNFFDVFSRLFSQKLCLVLVDVHDIYRYWKWFTLRCCKLIDSRPKCCSDYIGSFPIWFKLVGFILALLSFIIIFKTRSSISKWWPLTFLLYPLFSEFW